ncbi:MAG: hypothetical protein K2L44_08550, partial [Duncaniella sp.]|nr:hypothetical protein [Duncaniella sp.]
SERTATRNPTRLASSTSATACSDSEALTTRILIGGNSTTISPDRLDAAKRAVDDECDTRNRPER